MKKWFDYLWIWSLLFFILGFFYIGFAWLGMLDFFIPLLFALFGGNKYFCNHLCGRGQWFSLLGKKFSRKKNTPSWMYSKWFRYGFLLFFLTMFGNLIFLTYGVALQGENVREVLTLFWTFRIPFSGESIPGLLPRWALQFSYGFYSLMVTSALIGMIVMVLYKPRTWCGFCPMGTMTQEICKIHSKKTK
ncbi:4Fe-4S binding protein [Peptoniphilus sp. KCTC 25270]|uniref:4Fe-4S binding protein n=1 Tax=Peptoniphilus sp. KCTC 25270 TaxID=2897414 RepID=UPI001E28575E|nr:4Fe-4S binding protein [Peptoniphilus sp. KCTC 25270]MCD1147524.1 4Fe-4S binding protein [Peptoniphilus sp. KCTC 25270]